ncbi:MAG: hypothetical protein WC527_01670 [Candidatus Margulisiibacteriota bacterium]
MANTIDLRAAKRPGGGILRTYYPDLNRDFRPVVPDFLTGVPRHGFMVMSGKSIVGARIRPGPECVDQIGGRAVKNILFANEIVYIDPLVIIPKKMAGFAASERNRGILRSSGLKVRGDDYSWNEVVNAICGRMMAPTDENFVTGAEIMMQQEKIRCESLVKAFLSGLDRRILPPSQYSMLDAFIGFFYLNFFDAPRSIDVSTIRGCIAIFPLINSRFTLSRIAGNITEFFAKAFVQGNDEIGWSIVPPDVAEIVCRMIGGPSPSEDEQ